MSGDISETSIKAALDQLLGQIAERTSAPDEDHPAKTAELEKLAKAVSVHLKTLSDIQTHNAQADAKERNARYTAYEDFPPPSPEDRERFIQRLQERYHTLASQCVCGRIVEKRKRRGLNATPPRLAESGAGGST